MPLLKKRILTQNWFTSDEQFNRLYPVAIQALTHRHWTPLRVIRKAADFLAAENKVRILDIGSGVGKFCLAAAHYKPAALYYGVEQRKTLVQFAESAKEKLALENVSFVHGNFTSLDFNQYDHFYFYNAFYENLAGTDKIDDSIDYSCELFNYYNHYLYKQLEKKPPGTKLVTFHSLENEVPRNYHVIHAWFDNLLKCWMKV